MGYKYKNCISLSSITIPNNCSIEYRAFYGCSNLTSVTIGSGCRLLFEKIFANCQKLTDVYCYAVQVPPTSHNVFLDSNIENATLHVPAESIELYKTTLPWSNFGTIVALDGDTPKPNKCATPTISYANGKLKFNCETDDVLFNPTIKNDDIKPYNHTEEIDFCVTYQISVYATREGYEDSDVATATLCWIDVEPATEGIVDEDAVTEVKAVPVLIQTQGGNITIQGAAEGTPIAIYDIEGKQYGSTIADKDRATITTSLRPGSIAIVKIGEKAVKVAIK